MAMAKKSTSKTNQKSAKADKNSSKINASAKKAMAAPVIKTSKVAKPKPIKAKAENKF